MNTYRYVIQRESVEQSTTQVVAYLPSFKHLVLDFIIDGTRASCVYVNNTLSLICARETKALLHCGPEFIPGTIDIMHSTLRAGCARI